MPTPRNQVGTEAGGGVYMLTSRIRALEAMNQPFQYHVVKKEPPCFMRGKIKKAHTHES